MVVRTACHFPAPVDMTASREVDSVFSIASVNSLAIIPMECNPKARMPGNGPMPTELAKMAAKTSVGMARVRAMIPRATAITVGCGEVFRAAINASGMLNNTARVVPMRAIQIVSIVVRNASGKLSNIGGNMYRIKFQISLNPPKTVDNVMSIYSHDQTRATTKLKKMAEMTLVRQFFGARGNADALFTRGSR